MVPRVNWIWQRLSRGIGRLAGPTETEVAKRVARLASVRRRSKSTNVGEKFQGAPDRLTRGRAKKANNR